MRISEKLKNEAAAAGCEAALAVWDGVIDNLQRDRPRNIAVLGETSCGKTSLLNRFAGQVVRRPAMVSMEEQPLMLTSRQGERKADYEIVELNPGKWGGQDISFFEIPINMAVDYESRELSPMLEEMDAVIYVLSAVAPFTGYDAGNIAAVAGKLPMLFYLSKADLLAEDERTACMEYAERRIADHLEGAELIDSLRPDALEVLIRKALELSAEDARQAHIDRLAQQAARIMAQNLERRLAALEAGRRAQEAEWASVEQIHRSQMLEWDRLRVELMERAQRTMEMADQRLNTASAEAKRRLLREVKDSGWSRDWLNQGMEPVLQWELEDALNGTLSKAADRAGADAAWLASEAHRNFGVQVKVEELNNAPTAVLPMNGPYAGTMATGRGKLAAAAGSGLIASGALLSSMPLLPTCIVALPASFAAIHLLQESMEDQERYRQELEEQVSQCCAQNFRTLASNLRCALEEHYSNMLSTVQGPEMDPQVQPIHGDLGRDEELISEMLENLKREYGLEAL